VEYVEIFGFFQNSFALRKTPHDLLRSDSAQEARSAPMRGEAAFLGSTDRHAEQGSLQQFVSPRRMSKISQREKRKVRRCAQTRLALLKTGLMAEAVLTPRNKDLKTGIWTRAAPLTKHILPRAQVQCQIENCSVF
jgi:hypothetical protein